MKCNNIFFIIKVRNEEINLVRRHGNSVTSMFHEKVKQYMEVGHEANALRQNEAYLHLDGVDGKKFFNIANFVEDGVKLMQKIVHESFYSIVFVTIVAMKKFVTLFVILLHLQKMEKRSKLYVLTLADEIIDKRKKDESEKVEKRVDQ